MKLVGEIYIEHFWSQLNVDCIIEDDNKYDLLILFVPRRPIITRSIQNSRAWRWPTRLVSWLSIMKLWTCFSARVSSSLRARTATTSAVHPEPCTHTHSRLTEVAHWSSGERVGLATRWSSVRFSAAAANTGMGDGLWAAKPPRHFTEQPRPTQPPILSGTGNEYRPQCGDAVWLGSKGRYSSFQMWINVWVAGNTPWILVNTCHTRAL